MGKDEFEKEALSYYSQVFGFLVKRVYGDVKLAEDLVQDTYIKVLKNRESYKAVEGRSMRYWITSIAVNVHTDYYRVESKMVKTDLEDITYYMANPEDPYDATEDLRKVRIAIKQLSPRQKFAVLAIADGRSHQSIANEIGCEKDAIRYVVHAGRTRLRTLLNIKKK